MVEPRSKYAVSKLRNSQISSYTRETVLHSATHTIDNPTPNCILNAIVSAMANAFEAHDMTCRIPMPNGTKKTIFAHIDLTVKSGEIIDITGPSGCGKSTLLTAFARLNRYSTGQLALHGISAKQYSPAKWRTQVAYIPQQPILIGKTVADALRMPFGMRIRHATQSHAPNDLELEQLLTTLGCADIEMQRPIHELSGGQAARISLARTLLTKPQVLLADEVDAALDPDNAHLVSQLLQHIAIHEHVSIIRVRHSANDGIATRTLMLNPEGLHHVNQ